MHDPIRSSLRPSSRFLATVGKEETHASRENISSVIDYLKKQVTADRFSYIKEKIDANKQKLSAFTQHTYNLSKVRRNNTLNSNNVDSNLLTRRQDDALSTLHNLEPSERDNNTFCQEESSYASSTVLLGGGNLGGKNGIRPVKLSEIPKLPPYTTWIFLDRNQRMTEDQSVVGRRRIYYDQNCGEALICSESEDDLVDDEEENKEYRKVEDHIIRMTIQETDLSDTALELLAECFERTPAEIKARHETFVTEKTDESVKKEAMLEFKLDNELLERDLDAALDSFDNLFCRRCLVFDCRLHGCSQDLVFPTEKQQPWINQDSDSPCGIYCYKLLSSDAIPDTHEDPVAHTPDSGKRQKSPRKKTKPQQSESSSNARAVSESSESEVPTCQSNKELKEMGGGGGSIQKKKNKRAAERVLACIRKRQKEAAAASDSNSVVSRNDSKDSVLRKGLKKKRKSVAQKESSVADSGGEEMNDDELLGEGGGESLRKEFVGENTYKQVDTGGKSWKALEQGLFFKGLEIFGRNSCLIGRNLLSGMKTCREVFQYMSYFERNGAAGVSHGGASIIAKWHGKENEMRARSRFVRRRGRVRRLKYTWKSAGYHSIRKRITERMDQPCRQYNPCGCQTACGKQCSCLLNGTCCEKYCGCPKICKNRFRGCHCAKSQCRSRQCPCFAANRECDPDVCRNCWVSCGDGTLGVPYQRGDNYECRNMKLLLRQQQRVLLGRSDVSGWGAFLKNSVGKHEYLGEYTGELISHREADKRGKIYDRENSSFLFNLNDQFVLDAYRMGDKLKFANHSPDPNCYAKVIMVAGDHRVGIFAKERISAGEELFYDYRYEPDRAPAWARKPESGLGLKDDSQPSTGRAKKLA